jgi:hypothetical protein
MLNCPLLSDHGTYPETIKGHLQHRVDTQKVPTDKHPKTPAQVLEIPYVAILHPAVPTNYGNASDAQPALSTVSALCLECCLSLRLCISDDEESLHS